jgi:hypothetical protein
LKWLKARYFKEFQQINAHQTLQNQSESSLV